MRTTAEGHPARPPWSPSSRYEQFAVHRNGDGTFHVLVVAGDGGYVFADGFNCLEGAEWTAGSAQRGNRKLPARAMTGNEWDVLLRLQRWRQRLERSAATDRETCRRRVTIGRAISEIERLRRRIEELEGERAKLEAIASAPLRLRVPR